MLLRSRREHDWSLKHRCLWGPPFGDSMSLCALYAGRHTQLYACPEANTARGCRLRHPPHRSRAPRGP